MFHMHHPIFGRSISFVGGHGPQSDTKLLFSVVNITPNISIIHFDVYQRYMQTRTAHNRRISISRIVKNEGHDFVVT